MQGGTIEISGRTQYKKRLPENNLASPGPILERQDQYSDREQGGL
jgi:hypothetical protein